MGGRRCVAGIRQPLVLLDESFGTRRVFDAEVGRADAGYELAAEVGVPEIAQALASAGRGVAVVTDEPAYGLHAVAVTGAGGRLSITLHAAWNPSPTRSIRSASWPRRCGRSAQQVCVRAPKLLRAANGGWS
jgi:DNA-binding transcriptional LysR family regulator